MSKFIKIFLLVFLYLYMVFYLGYYELQPIFFLASILFFLVAEVVNTAEISPFLLMISDIERQTLGHTMNGRALKEFLII